MADERDRSPVPRRDRSRDRDERDYRDDHRDEHRDSRDDRHSARRSDRYDDHHSSSRRHHSRSRSRSRSPRRSSYRRRSQSPAPHSSHAPSTHAHHSAPQRSVGGPFNAPSDQAAEHAQRSIKENRVYVGNLSYEVRYKDLENFMMDAGLDVAFTEILVTPTHISKGCGIVEFTNREDAVKALTEFTDKPLLGRPIFVREDREQEARFGAPPSQGRLGHMAGGPFGGHGMGGPSNQLYIGNLPYQATWQDLKDLFRPAGAIIRADVQMFPDGRPKGGGTVVFENAEDAANAMAQFNGFDWYGRRLEVREDRFAHGGGGFRGGFGGGFRGGFMPRGGFGGGFRGGRGGFGMGGMGYMGHMGHMGHMGGMGGGFPAGGRQFPQDPYADYKPSGPAAGWGSGGGGGFAGASIPESKQILVNNLPWSTSNEDLVELFETTGEVVAAEILLDYNTGRSRGQGICEFVAIDQATTAIAKFTGYVYGGRPLEVKYNPGRTHTFTETAARAGATA
ncbi:rna-binding domain-containing protein [Phaffia rhodozyma]|uniref:Rna-binding domain-containing protein n=1 Tax=Phaffia rhodozyma TaxID=264483 RepID=A0A0F7SK99_PHARH|nr:rna-binding domain-containing protein [Phaffia rhodozyma]